jgi:RNA-binding protein
MISLRAKAKRAHHGPADVIIGKKGLTEEVLREIETRLKAKGFVKVKILKRGIEAIGLDRRTAARVVSERLNARLAGVRGRTFVIYRELSSESGRSRERASLRAKNRAADLRPW